MKKCNLQLALAGVLMLFLLTLQGQTIIHYISAPGTHCQDVTWDGTNIWTTDYTTRSYYELNPADGSVLYTIPYPEQFPYSEGMTFDGQYLWTCGWKENNGNGSHLFKIDPNTGELLADFDYPGGYYENFPHGLTYAWGYIWANNFETKTLDKINPATGELEGTLPAPGEYSIGIAWDGSYFWTNDFDQDLIFKQDPYTGAIVGSIPMPVVNMRGMEWDGDYLWMVNWQTETIYQVDVGLLSVKETDGFAMKIYPNPGEGFFHINTDAQPDNPIKIRVTDIGGRILKDVFLQKQSTGTRGIELDLRDLSNGIYLVSVEISGKLLQEKLIVNK